MRQAYEPNVEHSCVRYQRTCGAQYGVVEGNDQPSFKFLPHESASIRPIMQRMRRKDSRMDSHANAKGRHRIMGREFDPVRSDAYRASFVIRHYFNTGRGKA